MALNYGRIDKLARMYISCLESNKAKTLVFNELLKEYEPLIHKLYKTVIGNHEDLKSVFIFQLLTALSRFNVKRKVKFNTFSYGYLRGAKRIFLKDYCYPVSSELVEKPYDEIGITDYNVDLPAVLDTTDRFILNAYCNGKCGFVGRLSYIREKLTEYIAG